MNKFQICLLNAFLLITFVASGQGKVLITGRFKPKIENTTVSVYLPIDGYFNMSYPDSKAETSVINGEFRLSVNLERPGFIRLQSKGMPKTYFYAEPNSLIELTFIKDETGKIKTIYSGDNADANNLLTNNSPMNNQDFLQNKLPEIFQSQSADILLERVVDEMNTATLPFSVMLRKKKISNACYDAMLRETEQTIIHWTSTYLKNYFINDSELKQVSKLDRVEINKLAKKLFEMFDPYSSKYIIASRTYNNTMIKSILIQDGIIESAPTRTKEWSQYEKEFGMIVSRLSAIDNAPQEVQMRFMGTSLLSAIMFKPMSDKDFIKVFNTYYSLFPDSKCNAIITDYLAESTQEKETIKSKSEFGVYLLQGKDETIIEQNYIDIDAVTSIQELIKKHFHGQSVFVDFWATWCSPCISEFQNEPYLSAFLEKEKVTMLYVSIDKKLAMENWKKSIMKYQLVGYHYLANEQIKTNLEKWFFGIPRYMLFNSNGDLINDNLSRPSSKEVLYEQLRGLLKEN